ncbi:MAG: DUF1778 domain-containing protein, partial [Terriglobales bacterium]
LVECALALNIFSLMTNQAVARRQEARVSARVPKRVQDRLQYAADLTGATLNQFMVQSALKEAEAIIERENLITLSKRDAEVFFRALANPPAPSAALKRAAARYAEKFDAASQRIEWSPRQRVVRLRKRRAK